MASPTALPPGNYIVDAMHGDRTLLGRAAIVTLQRSDPTTIAETTMRTVDFPVTALMSIIGTTGEGELPEATGVGFEAFVEVDAALGSQLARRTAMCSFGGTVVRVPIEDFQTSLERSSTFLGLVHQAIRARTYTTEQIALCNARHSTTQRLARWLLLAGLRLRRSDLSITHELLAAMLGVRRASLSLSAGELAAAGAIEQGRGTLALIEPARLENAACECLRFCADALRATTNGTDSY